MCPFEKQIDIGDSSLYVKVNGSGRPAVVFEAGLGDDSTIWHKVETEVSKFTTTIIYDRVNLGRSSKAISTPTLWSTVNNLDAMLMKLNCGPTYILVGHSIGGLLIRLYASQHSAKTAGIILVDAPHEHQTRAAKEALSPLAWEMISLFWRKNEEGIDLAHELEQLEEVMIPSSIPVTALVATRQQSPPMELPAGIVQEIKYVATEVFPLYQKKMVENSTSGRLVEVPDASHYIHLEQPESIVTAIRSMIPA